MHKVKSEQKKNETPLKKCQKQRHDWQIDHLMGVYAMRACVFSHEFYIRDAI